MPDLPYLSIVIPAYNEAQRLPPTLAKLTEFLQVFTRSWEVLIVVEPSEDGTLELARQHAAQQANFRVIANEVRGGKGYAVRQGMTQAKGEIIFYMDADLSVPLECVHEFLRYFEEHPGVHVLIGNRQHAQSRITRRQSFLRQRMGEIFNHLLRALTIAELHDTQCGFKAFRRDAAREIFARQTIDGFAFDVEVLLLAQRLGYRMQDLPVEWINSPESKVHIIRDSLRMLWDVLQIRRALSRIPAREVTRPRSPQTEGRPEVRHPSAQ